MSCAGAPPEIPGVSFGEVLGAGGFAVVWSATRDGGGAPVVVKVGRASAPVMVERFRREAEAMERIGPPLVPGLTLATPATPPRRRGPTLLLSSG